MRPGPLRGAHEGAWGRTGQAPSLEPEGTNLSVSATSDTTTRRGDTLAVGSEAQTVGGDVEQEGRTRDPSLRPEMDLSRWST